jgi:sec-independent protein translocase protein TatB
MRRPHRELERRMIDIISSKLLILAIVALIVVGPKDLPILLRTVGKYLGVVRRHAAEFRAQFDEVLREAELQDLNLELEGVGREMRSTIEEGGAAIDEHVMTARSDVSRALEDKAREPEGAVEAAPPAPALEPPLPEPLSDKQKSEAP